MFAGKSVLGVIPARSGSQRLPGKNIRPLLGVPLIGWSHRSALASRYLNRTILSTDCEQIAATGRQLGMDVPFLRPPELATDRITTVDVVLHALDHVDGKYDFVVLLQPTSPGRTGEDIDECIKRAVESSSRSCASVSLCEECPWWMYTLDGAQKLQPILGSSESIEQRQSSQPVFRLNGAVYAIAADVLRVQRRFVFEGTVGYQVSRQRSIDIDTEDDFVLAEQFLQGRQDKMVA